MPEIHLNRIINSHRATACRRHVHFTLFSCTFLFKSKYFRYHLLKICVGAKENAPQILILFMSTCFVSNPNLGESTLPPLRGGAAAAAAAGGSGAARPGRGGLSAAVRRRLAAQGEGGGGGGGGGGCEGGGWQEAETRCSPQLFPRRAPAGGARGAAAPAAL